MKIFKTAVLFWILYIVLGFCFGYGIGICINKFFPKHSVPSPVELSIWNMCQMSDTYEGGTEFQRQQVIDEMLADYVGEKVSFVGKVYDVAASLYGPSIILISPTTENPTKVFVYIDKKQLDIAEMLSKGDIIGVEGTFEKICSISFGFITRVSAKSITTLEAER